MYEGNPGEVHFGSSYSVRFKLGGFELSGVNCIKLNSFPTTKKVPLHGFIKVKFEYFE